MKDSASRIPPWLRRPRRPRRAKLRTRVLVGVLLVTVTALTVFDVAAVSALRRYMLGHTDGQLATVTRLYRPVPHSIALPPGAVNHFRRATPGQATLGGFRRIGGLKIAGPLERLSAPIFDQYYLEFLRGNRARKVLVAGNPNLRPPPVSWIAVAKHKGVRTVIAANGRTQLRVQAVPMSGGILVATTSLADVNKTVDRLRLILIIGSVLAGLLVALGVALVVRRGLRPIETMATQADRITAGDLTERVSPEDAATEVGRLSTALNDMLGRIEVSIREREASQELTRRFFADASHELRNPLASLRANAELYQQGVLRDRAAVDEAMRRISLEARRMSGLVDDMLRLARLDQHPDQHDDVVDVTALVTACADRARAVDPGRSWRARIARGLETTGDEEQLRRAIDNLLANVTAHTPAGTEATITATSSGGEIVVEVSDDGPGIPHAELSRIFDRFYRAGASMRRPGSGLGLSIVAAIVNTHGGTTAAALNNPCGLRVTLTLPEGARFEVPQVADDEVGPRNCHQEPAGVVLASR